MADLPFTHLELLLIYVAVEAHRKNMREAIASIEKKQVVPHPRFGQQAAMCDNLLPRIYTLIEEREKGGVDGQRTP